MWFGKVVPVVGGAAAVASGSRTAFLRTAAIALAPRDTRGGSKIEGGELQKDFTKTTCGIELALHRRHRTRARWALSTPSTALATRSGTQHGGGDAGAARGLHTSASAMKKKEEEEEPLPMRKGGWDATATTSKSSRRTVRRSRDTPSSEPAVDLGRLKAAEDYASHTGLGPRIHAPEDDTILQDKGILQVNILRIIQPRSRFPAPAA